MHTENLGEKTYLMTVDPEQIEKYEAGNGTLTFMAGSTETRLNLKASLVSALNDTPFMATVTGNAKLHISIGDDCQIVGFEEMDVQGIAHSDITMRDASFAELIPF